MFSQLTVFKEKVNKKRRPPSADYPSTIFRTYGAGVDFRRLFQGVHPSVPCPLCPLPSVLCPPTSALCPLSSALRPLPSALCLLPSDLCPLTSVLCPLSSALCPLSLRCTNGICNRGGVSAGNVLGCIEKNLEIDFGSTAIISACGITP